jgi:small GTP-binding protein
MRSGSLGTESLAFKVCICGQQGVGKTALVNRRTSGAFHADYRPTIAGAFAAVTETYDDKTVVLNVWDTAGQEKYQNMMPLYFRNSACVVVVLDISNAISWDFVKRWIATELPAINPRPIVIVCANKTDLPAAQDMTEIDDWAKELGYPVFHTSALTGADVAVLVHEMARLLVTGRMRTSPTTERIEGGGSGSKCC